MLLLRQPHDRLQAYLLRDILGMNGIKAHVFNQHATSIVGEVPPDGSMPQLWLDDEGDLARAEAVLKAHEASAVREGANACPECHEDNPPSFEVCWKCGRYLFPE
ncbi:MAG: DUF2007 domain-containing protein [Casimicrobiaceae bacterium]